MNAVERSTAGADLTALSRGRSGSDSVGRAVPRPRRRWKTRVLVPAVIIAAVLGLLAYAARGMLTPEVEVRVVPVVVKAGEGRGAAEMGSTVIVQAPGWIEPDPFAISVPALVEGVVKEVLVLEGEMVEAGQVVARLFDEELRLAEQTARAGVAEREAEIVRAQAAVEASAARVLVEQAALDELQDEIERKRELVEAGGLSAGEFRRKEIRLAGLEAAVLQARSAAAEAKAGLKQAEAALETARAVHAEAALRRERAEVRAPVDGVVLARLVEPGSRISMGRGEGGMAGAVVRLYDPAKLQVRVDVPLSDAAKVGVGTAAQVTTEALANEVFAGKVMRVVHEANIQRNTVQFKVGIENPSPQLKPEMLCRVKFLGSGGAARGGAAAGVEKLLLAREAVLGRSGERGRVWLVEHGGAGMVARLREVRLGAEEGEDVQILEGVRPGDRAVVDAPQSLREGARVRVVGEFAEGGE